MGGVVRRKKNYAGPPATDAKNILSPPKIFVWRTPLRGGYWISEIHWRESFKFNEHSTGGWGLKSLGRHLWTLL